jgi:hypothetical protein
MRKILTLAFITTFSLTVFAQDNQTQLDITQHFPQWGKLPKGKYFVGYKDTVIFKYNENFSYFNYNGSKPVFMSIWYPAVDHKNVKFMKFKNYISVYEQANYKQLSDTLIERFKRTLIKDAICININNMEEVSYSDKLKKLYSDILETEVNAKKNLTAVKGKFPCIFYHHGHQSSPYDNNVFFEYMASNGFIVVSANYSLPDEKQNNLLIVSNNSRFDELTDLEFVLGQTKKMQNIDTNNITAVGHSWGAQTFIRFDNKHKSKSFHKIISLHTTMEDKSLKWLKDWTQFDYLFKDETKNSTTPVVFFAPIHIAAIIDTDTITGKETYLGTDTLKPKYAAFKCNTTTPYTFITIKHNLTHDGFISFGNWRFPYCKKYNLTDCGEIITQQYYYEQIITLTHEIIKSNSEKLIVPKDIINNSNINVEFFNQRQ